MTFDGADPAFGEAHGVYFPHTANPIHSLLCLESATAKQQIQPGSKKHHEK